MSISIIYKLQAIRIEGAERVVSGQSFPTGAVFP